MHEMGAAQHCAMGCKGHYAGYFDHANCMTSSGFFHPMYEDGGPVAIGSTRQESTDPSTSYLKVAPGGAWSRRVHSLHGLIY
jgi:hypothetical protein